MATVGTEGLIAANREETVSKQPTLMSDEFT